MKPTVPKPVRVITGDQNIMQKTIDNFFKSTRDYILRTENVLPMDFEFKAKGPYSNNESSGSTPLDDRVSMLLYREVPVAVVTETRTEFNNVQYCFFLNLDNISVPF